MMLCPWKKGDVGSHVHGKKGFVGSPVHRIKVDLQEVMSTETVDIGKSGF